MDEKLAVADHPRPWIDHYPPGIEWDVKVDTTPVHEQFLAACARMGDKPALDFLEKKTSFAELGEAVTLMAGALQQRFGVTKGTRIALMLPNTPFYIIAYFAILKAGGTVVNCNPLYTVPELSHIMANSGADVLVTLDLAQLFEKAESLRLSGHVKTVVACHFPDALPMVKRVLYTVAKSKDLANPSRSRIAQSVVYWNDLLAMKARPTSVPINPTKDIAVQQYTGGTTGLPKGAMLSHANISANMSQIDKWGVGLFYPPSKVVAVLPFFHIFAMTVCMNVPLCNGIEVVMLPRFEMKAFLDLVARTRPNILPAVPTLLHAIANNRQLKPELIDSIEVAVSGGAPLSDETRAAFAKVSKALLAEGYGLTEASPVVCCAALRVPSKPRSIGQPLPATDVRLIDIETMQPAALGERGELQVKGPQVMVGYYENPDETRASFTDGWLRTGDVGIMDEDGYLYIVDRIKDLIIVNGFNVYPRNIEQALMAHEAVEEVTVIGVPDEVRGEAPVAYIKLREGKTTDATTLRSFLDNHISRIEMPKEIYFKDQLPKTLIGKLSKKELREEYKQMKAAGAAGGRSDEQARE